MLVLIAPERDPKASGWSRHFKAHASEKRRVAQRVEVVLYEIGVQVRGHHILQADQAAIRADADVGHCPRHAKLGVRCQQQGEVLFVSNHPRLRVVAWFERKIARQERVRCGYGQSALD